MTRVVAENGDLWTLRKIQSWVELEKTMLNMKINEAQRKIFDFEKRYGKLDRESLYGKIDDMELIEWEGELETMGRLHEKMTCLDQILFEVEPL
jgi:hypothetical protein